MVLLLNENVEIRADGHKYLPIIFNLMNFEQMYNYSWPLGGTAHTELIKVATFRS